MDNWTEVIVCGFAITYGKTICFDKRNYQGHPGHVDPATVAVRDAANSVLSLYPRIYFACHTRHVRDPQSGRLLSRHQASVLDHLDELEPTTLVDLSRHMGVTAGTMSVAIDRLERKGYVVRLRDAADRRKVHVRLTSAGVRVREATSVLDPARVEALMARLSDVERERAVEGLALLARAAQEQMHAAARRDDAQKAEGGTR